MIVIAFIIVIALFIYNGVVIETKRKKEEKEMEKKEKLFLISGLGGIGVMILIQTFLSFLTIQELKMRPDSTTGGMLVYDRLPQEGTIVDGPISLSGSVGVAGVELKNGRKIGVIVSLDQDFKIGDEVVLRITQTLTPHTFSILFIAEQKEAKGNGVGYEGAI